MISVLITFFVFLLLFNGYLFVLLTILFTFFVFWVEFQCYCGVEMAAAAAAACERGNRWYCDVK